MVVTNKRIETRLIGADLIEEVTSFKYLGIHMYTHLKNDARINYLKSKLS